TDSPQLLQFLGAVTGSLTMSSNLGSIQGLAGLAYSARGLRPDTIAFMTVPWQYDPSNPNNVVLTDDAVTVFDNLKHDRPLSDVIAEEEPEDSESAAGKDGSTGDDESASDTADEGESTDDPTD